MRALRMAPVFPSATTESVSTPIFLNYKKAAAILFGNLEKVKGAECTYLFIYFDCTKA